MCIRKGYILTLGYEKGAIWVKKTGILKGKGLSLGAEPPPADSLDSSTSDENVDAQSRLSYKPSDGCCLVVLPKVNVALRSI